MKLSKNKVILIGCNGFIGQAVLSELDNNFKKNFDIISLVRSYKNCEAIKEKLIKSTDDIVNFIRDFSPSIILDLSGSYKTDNYFQIHKKNLEVPIAILEFLKTSEMKCHYILASSAAIYRPKNQNIEVTESCDLCPTSIYGVVKLNLENICIHYADKHNLNISVARIFNVIGPGQPKILFPSVAIHSLIDIKSDEKQNEDNHGAFVGLNFMRDFLDVRDVARALCCLINEKSAGLSIYNICSGKGTYLSDLYKKIYYILKGRHVSGNFFDNDDEGFSIYGNNEKFCSHFDWSPSIDIECSLEDQINELIR
jgi:nucleoside-diphosphate-sugar epimerase